MQVDIDKFNQMLSQVPDNFEFKGVSFDKDNKMVLHFDFTEKAYDKIIYDMQMEELQRLLNDCKGE